VVKESTADFDLVEQALVSLMYYLHNWGVAEISTNLQRFFLGDPDLVELVLKLGSERGVLTILNLTEQDEEWGNQAQGKRVCALSQKWVEGLSLC